MLRKNKLRLYNAHDKSSAVKIPAHYGECAIGKVRFRIRRDPRAERPDEDSVVPKRMEHVCKMVDVFPRGKTAEQFCVVVLHVEAAIVQDQIV